MVLNRGGWEWIEVDRIDRVSYRLRPDPRGSRRGPGRLYIALKAVIERVFFLTLG